MSTNKLVSKVGELKELQAMAEELQAEIDSIQDTIETEMSPEELMKEM